jgi:signal transduction histidine kinase
VSGGVTRGAGVRVRTWFERGGWVAVWVVVYVASLVGATTAAVLDDELSSPARLGIASLALLEAGWYVFVSVRWRYWEAPPARFAVAMTVAGGLWLALLVAHPAFWWTIFAAYGAAACPWLRRSVPTVVILTALILLADDLDGGRPIDAGRVAFWVGVGALVLLAHATIGAITAESERRRQLIVELEATRAELAAAERAAGALAERERLARDIHDALAQAFTSIVMLLETADARLRAGSAGALAPIDQALQTARDGLAEARRIVWALGPGAREPGALVASLERLAQRTGASGGVEVDVVVTGEPTPLDAGRELALLRTAQEAVSNAYRHAAARRITITLSFLGDSVILDVADDGRGFDPGRLTPRSGGGFGLANLTERARQAGGHLTIDSTPDEGTTVTLVLPVGAMSPTASQPEGTS